MRPTRAIVTLLVGAGIMIADGSGGSSPAKDPRLHMSDPAPISGDYDGAAGVPAALSEGKMAARSLASADFDEDGVADLLVVHADGAEGVLALHRGNVDSIYPNAPEAKKRRAEGAFTPEPFLPDIAVFPAAEPCDLAGAGDFDADGHQDAVAARLGGMSLWLHRGDGKGGLSDPEKIPLPGPIEAMVVGEVNRRDGLRDLVVAAGGAGGSRVLVFEHPDGALARPPEVVELPAGITDLALGHVDPDNMIDFVAAAGSHLVLIHGRDRRLSWSPDRRAAVGPPSLTSIDLPYTATSLALGEFLPARGPDLALLDGSGRLAFVPVLDLLGDPAGAVERLKPAPIAGWSPAAGRRPVLLRRAHLSALPGDDLVLLAGSASGILTRSKADPDAGRAIALSLRGALDALPMRLGPDPLDDLVLAAEGSARPLLTQSLILSTFTVTNTNDSGPGSLRDAIAGANLTAGMDEITFNIPGPGVHTIRPATIFFSIYDSVLLDGTSQPGYAGVPIIEINGASLSGATQATGLMLSVTPSTVRGLAINGFATGDPLLDQFSSGVRLLSGDGHILEGNFVGLDPTGTIAVPNAFGINMISTCCGTIGGSVAAARNVISGNSWGQIFLGGNMASGEAITDVLIRGNRIGTNASGTSRVDGGGMGFGAVAVGSKAVRSQIGGTSAGAGNLVVATDDAVRIFPGDPGSSRDTLVQGNLIGTDVTGTAALGYGGGFSSDGVIILAGFMGFENEGNTVGGTTPSARNVIAGNQGMGVSIEGPAAGLNLVQGNHIGVDVSGSASLPNSGHGVAITESADNLVGGSATGARNVISANAGNGVAVEGAGASFNVVQNNLIGTDATGTSGLGNDAAGVSIHLGGDTRIGGSETFEPNLISGNSDYGISIDNAPRTVIQGNFIGTDRFGTSRIGNYGGMKLTSGAEDSLIGGSAPGEANVISGNNQAGIRLEQPNTSRNRVEGNMVGTDPSGTLDVFNGFDGIVLADNATANTIGGASPAQGNTIKFNAAGVTVHAPATSANLIRNNRIDANRDIGIELFPRGVTANDPGDADTGANTLQNYPVLSSAATTGGQLRVVGSLDSTPDTDFTLEFFHSAACDPSGYGEGANPIAAVAGRTDSSGALSFDLLLSASVPDGAFVTATASDPGATSEFSACATAAGIPPAVDPNVLWPDLFGSRLEWPGDPGASFFNVYEGVRSHFISLQSPNADACRRAVVQQPTTGDILTRIPPPGSMLWFLVTAGNQYGEGSAGEGAQGPRSLQAAGACGLSCAHDRCLTGGPLLDVCDSSVATICAGDPFCCQQAWDSFCVQEVRTVWNSLACPDSAGQCSHGPCESGSALQAGCDSPPLAASCVAGICQADPFCCQQAWDDLCVGEVVPVCGYTCD